LAVPVSDGEAWASLHFGNVSRGLSHELVRHGDWTAISQRSTRFVDESEGEWVPHPLIGRDQGLLDQFMAARDVCRPAYDRLVEGLQKEMKARGVDGTAARKQARGAARGVLGNALETQLVFSANVRQWKWMVQKRCSHAADAEIRVAFACALRLLKKAMPARFAGGDWDLLPAKDGIGEVVRCED
jgi:thymidylate synthase (FAD)